LDTLKGWKTHIISKHEIMGRTYIRFNVSVYKLGLARIIGLIIKYGGGGGDDDDDTAQRSISVCNLN
jgi:hypothetical protein